jgi:hypothetical protein
MGKEMIFYGGKSLLAFVYISRDKTCRLRGGNKHGFYRRVRGDQINKRSFV